METGRVSDDWAEDGRDGEGRARQGGGCRGEEGRRMMGDRDFSYSHGGDIYGRNTVGLDFSVNTNPLGMPEAVREAVMAHPEDFSLYPDIHCRGLRRALAGLYGDRGAAFLEPGSFICGNGASDLLYSLIFALRPRKAVLFVPCFGEYEAALRAGGCEVRPIILEERENFSIPAAMRRGPWEEIWEGAELLILANPNNPTGTAFALEEMRRLADFCRERGIFLVIDECFGWFMREPDEYSGVPLLREYDNVFLLNAFTKIFSMAGLRLGYGICGNRAVMERLTLSRQPWSVSGPAVRAGIAAISQGDFVRRTVEFLEEERRFLSEGLRRIGFSVFPSMVNYLLFKSPFEVDLCGSCLERGVLIRACANFRGLDGTYFRVAVRGREENEKLLDCLSLALRAAERAGTAGEILKC